MSKKETKNTVKPHTEAKLKFYVHYLERYLPVLFKSPFINKINIYDMFCGQAIYDDGKESGAVRAFNKIKDVQRFNPSNNTEITLTLNDLSKKRINETKEWIELQEKTFVTCTHNEDATGLIRKLIEGINNKQNLDTRNLVFIDPYGYKEIDKSLIEGLLENGRTEVIVFLPINQMRRFKDKTQGENIEKDFLPLKKFVEQFNINVDNINSDIDLIREIEQSLTFEDDNFATSYHIKNQRGNHYALFFMTNHIYGLEKIIEVKWALDFQQGSGFDNTVQIDLFLEKQKTEELEEKLLMYLKYNRSNNDIYKWTLQQGFMPKHTNEILNRLKKHNKIDVEYLLDAKSGFHLNYKNYKNELIKTKIQLIL